MEEFLLNFDDIQTDVSVLCGYRYSNLSACNIYITKFADDKPLATNLEEFPFLSYQIMNRYSSTLVCKSIRIVESLLLTQEKQIFELLRLENT